MTDPHSKGELKYSVENLSEITHSATQSDNPIETKRGESQGKDEHFSETITTDMQYVSETTNELPAFLLQAYSETKRLKSEISESQTMIDRELKEIETRRDLKVKISK
jgi:hypothetical protein